MALIKCRECGHDVSTEAAACPNCGAPPPKVAPLAQAAGKSVSARSPGKTAAGILGLLVMVGILAKCIASPNATKPAESSSAATPAPAVVAEPPPPPAPPRHNYTMEQDGEYGYEPAVSDTDRKAGKAVNSMLMVRYNGLRGDVQRWSMVKAGVVTVFSCRQPCEFVKSVDYVQGMAMQEETMRVAPGSILEAVVEDIDNGFLKVYGARQQ